ncbi:hypothetical protein WA026_001616 [Henosepilachna vigintioctopunctata]|uniref:Uncharacterized protein n=1 Tax=Henosepilachna vigintioctopunctata TaxID=420089 RepID=A0AAW1UV40_9CUCU
MDLLEFQGNKHEAYVRVTLNQHFRNMKEKRTCIVRPSRDREFSFVGGFNFKLDPTQLDVSSIGFPVSSLHLGMIGEGVA